MQRATLLVRGFNRKRPAIDEDTGKVEYPELNQTNAKTESSSPHEEFFNSEQGFVEEKDIH